MQRTLARCPDRSPSTLHCHPYAGPRGAAATSDPSPASSWARAAHWDRRSACALGLLQRGPVPVSRGPPPADAAFLTVHPPQGLRGATAAAHPSLSSSRARTARRDRRKDCAFRLQQRGPAPVRRDRRWQPPLPSRVSPSQGLRGATAALHPSLSSPRARTARWDHRKIEPPNSRGAGPALARRDRRRRLPLSHSPPSTGSPWGYCRFASPAGLPAGSDCAPGSPQRLRLGLPWTLAAGLRAAILSGPGTQSTPPAGSAGGGAVISELRRCACGPSGPHPHLHPHGAGVASAMPHQCRSRVGAGLPRRHGRPFSPPPGWRTTVWRSTPGAGGSVLFWPAVP